MDKLEKVIRGLELCAGNSTCKWKKCPYNPKHIDHPNYPACRIKLENDALSLLKAQMPRVMTLEEAINGPQVGYLEFKHHPERGWVKCDFVAHSKDKEVVLLFSADVTFYQPEKSYWRLWRLWTSRPTDEQRRAAKWDEE